MGGGESGPQRLKPPHSFDAFFRTGEAVRFHGRANVSTAALPRSCQHRYLPPDCLVVFCCAGPIR